mmetsp:Transcript_29006/g.55658  ORF Transcript_29006/g.55658 Transcript_29006/m.55658 type:complete len:266 (-) Transcript_29006:599-1396(-)
MHHNDREIGRHLALCLRQFLHRLVRHCGVFNQPCGVVFSGCAQGAAHLVDVAPDLHHDQRVGVLHPRRQRVLVQRAHQHGQDIVAPGDRRARGRPGARHAGDGGHHVGRHIILEPCVEVHERAIEKRVALAEDHDILARIRQHTDPFCALGIEFAKHLVIARIAEGDFSGDGVFHRMFGRIGRQQVIGQRARLTGPTGFAEKGDMLCAPNQPVRADAEQVRVARAKADAVDGSSAHSLRLAMALTAATVIALPPSRPWTMQQGTG